MSGPYEPKPHDGVPTQPSITTPAPPTYTTFVGGYQQQPPRAQPHLLNTLPEVFHHNRNEEDEADPELAEEARIPVDHLNVSGWGCFCIATRIQ